MIAIPFTLRTGFSLLVGASLACCLSSCKKHSPASKAAAPDLPPALLANRLAELPGAVYRSQAESTLRWQPWTPETLELAREAKRLLFVVITMPQQPDFQGIIQSMEQDPNIVAAIHDHYVPVLVDGDAAREMGLLTADLCMEIKRPLHLPLFVWMTADANPVAWIPVSPAKRKEVGEVFTQSHVMVSKMWKDDPEYVLRNSAMDNAARRERIAQRRLLQVASQVPDEDAVRAARQLVSLYDPVSRTFDEAGGLFPASAIDLLASCALLPSLPEELRRRSEETVGEMMKDLLPSAMFDPLDGGVFSLRRRASWELPVFVKDCVNQARTAVALGRVYQATGDPLVLERMKELLAFAETAYRTEDGLFVQGMTQATPPEAWLWTLEEVERLLPAPEAALWIRYCGMKSLGNLPSEADPERVLFRQNSLGRKRSLQEIAAELDFPAEQAAAGVESARKTLLQAREERLKPWKRDTSPHAVSTFRMVSAYAAAYAATGEERFRDRALSTLQAARDAFAEGSSLKMFVGEAPPSLSAGRAFLYMLALQSVLDVAEITLDNRLVLWADDLATTAAERFTTQEFLKECPDAAKLVDLPVTDLAMLFDDSTAGLVSLSESRMKTQNRPLVESFSRLATPLPTFAIQRPVSHTDIILATVVRYHAPQLFLGEELPAELRTEVQRLPLRIVQRTQARPADEVPAGSLKLRFRDGSEQLLDSAEALRTALRLRHGAP